MVQSHMTDDEARCELCGELMPPDESMFKFHGYSGDCPKPPLPMPPSELDQLRAEVALLREVVAAADAMRRYDSYRMPGEPHWQYDVARAAIKEQTP